MSNRETELEPGHQLMLLYLHDDPRSKAVYRYLHATSTARESAQDLRDIEILGYARWDCGQTFLTNQGKVGRSRRGKDADADIRDQGAESSVTS